MRIVAAIIVAVALAVAGYFWVVFAWSYSTGERVGWVQKLSKKGWICKTWEGELTMISMPGAVPEKFPFTVRDDAVAEQINRLMGKRVALHYEEKVGLPTSCFGDTRYYVTRTTEVQDIQLGPGINIPVPAPSPSPAPPKDER
jgi:hypothetical protein